MTESERGARATTVLEILRRLDVASLDEVIAIDHSLHRLEVIRRYPAGPERYLVGEFSALEEALRLELTDIRLERERAVEARQEADRTAMAHVAARVLPLRTPEGHAGPVTLREGDSTWHDGPGWYYTLDDYPDDGSCGAFPSRVLAEQHARMAGHTVEIEGPTDADMIGAADVEIVDGVVVGGEG